MAMCQTHGVPRHHNFKHSLVQSIRGKHVVLELQELKKRLRIGTRTVYDHALDLH